MERFVSLFIAIVIASQAVGICKKLHTAVLTVDQSSISPMPIQHFSQNVGRIRLGLLCTLWRSGII